MAHGYGAGMQRARRMAAVRRDRAISQALMAALVSEELKRMDAKKANGETVTVSQSAWSDYEAERSEPSLIVVRATSRVSGLAEPDILFPQPPAPIDASQLRYLSPEEVERAERIDAEEQKKKKSKRVAEARPKGSGKHRA